MDGSHLEKTVVSSSVTVVIERIKRVTFNTWKLWLSLCVLVKMNELLVVLDALFN